MDNKQLAYEKRVNLLVGEAISQVTYYTYELGEENPAYSRFDGKFHWLDQGLLFKTQSEKVFCVAWGSEFDQYGLDFLTTKLFDPVDERHKDLIWDVTNHAKWQAYLRIPIASTKVYWSWGIYSSAPEIKIWYPQDMSITFENGRTLYLSASRYDERDDRFWGHCDDVIVVFDDAVAKKYLPMLQDDLIEK